MEDMSVKGISTENVSFQKSHDKNEPKVSLEQKPDTFERKTPTEMLIAGGTAVVAGKGAYEGAKTISQKGINWIENELKSFMSEAGKTFNGIPNSIKVAGKFAAAAAAGIGAITLALKDTDKDGKSDILEGLAKFVKPSNEE